VCEGGDGLLGCCGDLGVLVFFVACVTVEVLCKCGFVHLLKFALAFFFQEDEIVTDSPDTD